MVTGLIRYASASTLVLLLACAGAAAVYGCSSSTAPSPPSDSRVSIRLYPAYGLDPAIVCSRTRIKVIYFVPRGQESAVYAGWQAGAQAVFGGVAAFFRREFDGHLEIEFDILGTAVSGAQTEYPNESEMHDEIQDAVFTPAGAYYDPGFAMERPGEYTVRMIYYVNGAGGQHVDVPSAAYPWSRTAYNPWFWLEEVDSYGSVNSAHEFGHLLGMPHPWEMNPPHDAGPGDIMGYSTSGFTLMQCFVLEEMKRRMGLR